MDMKRIDHQLKADVEESALHVNSLVDQAMIIDHRIARLRREATSKRNAASAISSALVDSMTEDMIRQLDGWCRKILFDAVTSSRPVPNKGDEP